MELNIKNKLLGIIALAFLLLGFSCKDDTFSEFYNENGDEVTVTFNLLPEAAAFSTKAGSRSSNEGWVQYPDDKDPNSYSHISDGTKANRLIVAVYDENDNLIEDFFDESVESSIPHGRGQHVYDEIIFPFKLKLTFKRGVDYKVAFWAQSNKCNAYNTTDLKKVEVIYGNLNSASNSNEDLGNPDGLNTRDDDSGDGVLNSSSSPNNDEFRDAFCKSEPVFIKFNGTSETKNILLYRPLAQINVGTTGYDYEVVTRETENKYLYSKIRLNKVARYLDVVEDKIYNSTTNPDKPYDGEQTKEAFAVVDYNFAPIPAYINYQDPSEEYQGPDFPSYTRWDWIYDKEFEVNRTEDGKTININKNNYKEIYEAEEFLNVFTDESEKIGKHGLTPDEYKVNGFYPYANLNDYNDYSTETFKYLSMCYVLTSSTESKAAVIDNIKVWLATDQNGSNEYQIVDIESVPVQRNWRTNIIGNLLTEENSFTVKLDKDFAGEYSGWADDSWNWSGPLAYGVYYDAEADEIQISNVEGLIWFQQMVNGEMLVRELKDPTSGASVNFTALSGNSAKKDDKYTYNANDPFNYKTAYRLEKNNNGVVTKVYDANNRELSADEKTRILKATHQDTNKNSGWPSNGQFHFVGEEIKENGKTIRQAQATIKLMADIDLSGIEWIPIGFDGRILETVRFSSYPESDASNRGFYGIFDGNGHTISNMSTKRFGAQVPDNSQQASGNGPYDVIQWFGRGLFGEIGGDAKIRNVKLYNVDIYGCNGVGGIVGIAYGNQIEITGCVVDGGSIIVTPMYRGDSHSNKDRSFARGVYLGGIVGYFHTQGGIVDKNEVKNLYMQGYRRVGGLIGSFQQINLGKNKNTGAEEKDAQYPSSFDSNRFPSVYKEPYITSVSDNTISNTILIASQFSTFGMPPSDDYKVGEIIRSGFGWNKGVFELYANKFVGGYTEDIDEREDAAVYTPSGGKATIKGNTEIGLTFSEFTVYSKEGADVLPTVRYSELQGAPLKYLPILSSWFTDEINLNSNYYGEPSAYRLHNLTPFNIWSSQASVSNKTMNNNGNTFDFPMQLPSLVDIDWDKSSPKVGLYVESVNLSGINNSIGNRSVITPTGINGVGDCAIYIVPRNRNQFYNANNLHRATTKIDNIVVRGEPYAYTGILLCPNENMDKFVFDNVAIYDCYQTIAQDDWLDQNDTKKWPNYTAAFSSVAELEFTNSNLRGYTIPGPNWKSIKYDDVTFEVGAYTGQGKEVDARTCKVEAETYFNGCIFKAPYIIDIDLDKVSWEKVFFDAKCIAAAQTTSNKPVKQQDKPNSNGYYCSRIIITTNPQGDPEVAYQYGLYYYDNENELIGDRSWLERIQEALGK